MIPQIPINAEAVILSITKDYKFLIFLISYTVAQLKYKHTLPRDCKLFGASNSTRRRKGQDDWSKSAVLIYTSQKNKKPPRFTLTADLFEFAYLA